jgi:hypothetical protein
MLHRLWEWFWGAPSKPPHICEGCDTMPACARCGKHTQRLITLQPWPPPNAARYCASCIRDINTEYPW